MIRGAKQIQHTQTTRNFDDDNVSSSSRFRNLLLFADSVCSFLLFTLNLFDDIKIKKTKMKPKVVDGDGSVTEMEHLPQDLTTDIFSRLPISSLLQSRFVSKTWNTLTYDPNLVRMHFSVSSKKNPCLILHFDSPIRNHLCFHELSDQENQQVVKKLQLPFLETMPEFHIISSCNGLMCLSESLYSDPLYIYNPFTRQYQELPRSRQFEDQILIFGFGYHPVTDEYKVVKIVYYWNSYSDHTNQWRFRNFDRRSEVQILSLRTLIWRNIGEVPYEQLQRRGGEALLNGKLHYLTEPRNLEGGGRGRGVVSFDLSDEQFREVPGPDNGGLKRIDYYLVVLKGCLSAVTCIRFQTVDIWVMKEYGVKESWIKQYSFDSNSASLMRPIGLRPAGMRSHGYRRRVLVLCMLEDGKILIEHKGGVLVLHDPVDGTFRKLMTDTMPGLVRAFVHFGSLNWIDTPLSSAML